jgi:hypothetical protein
MKNYVDLEHDKLAKQWDLIHKKEKAIEEKLKEIERLKCPNPFNPRTCGDYQLWHECDGPYYLAKAKKELEELKKFSLIKK